MNLTEIKKEIKKMPTPKRQLFFKGFSKLVLANMVWG